MISICRDLEARTEFDSFVRKYSKAYELSDVEYRFSVFKAELESVRKHNAGNFSWQVCSAASNCLMSTIQAGINEFSDLTTEEFYGNMRAFKPVGRPQHVLTVPMVQGRAPTIDCASVV